MNFKEYLNESRSNAPQSSRDTTSENPLIVVYKNDSAGKPSMEGMMNLTTEMRLLGIDKKFQKEIAKAVLRAKGKKVDLDDIDSSILDFYRNEYRGQDISVWFELSPYHDKERKAAIAKLLDK